MHKGVKEEPPLEMSFQDVGTLSKPGPSRFRKRRLSAGKRPGLRLPDITESSIEAMNNLLKDWGLEALSERFAEHMIDQNALDYMLDVDIVDLCRDFPIRYRLVLRHNLQNKYHNNIVINDQSNKRRPQTIITFAKDPNAYSSDSPDRKKKKKKQCVEAPMEYDVFGSDTDPAHFVTHETTADDHNASSGTESGKEHEPNGNMPMPPIQSCQDIKVVNYALKHNDYSSDDEDVIALDDTNRDGPSMVEVLREKEVGLENSYENYNDEWANAHDRNLMAQYFPPSLADIPMGFTGCEGYIPAFRLKMYSDMTNSDYLFVKSMMEDLWPEGFAGRSVTGRNSNNISGRSGKGSLPVLPEQSPKIPLETHKVEYIRDRLLERRLLLGDDRVKAIQECKHANKFMARVIINWNKRSS